MIRFRVALIAATVVCAACGSVAIDQQPASHLTSQGTSVSTGQQIGAPVQLGSARNQAGSSRIDGSTDGVVTRTGMTQPQPPRTPLVQRDAPVGPPVAPRCGVRVGKIAPLCPVGS